MFDREYRKEANKTRNLDGELHLDSKGRQLLEGAIGLAGEMAEVTEPIKKFVLHGKPIDFEKLGKELSDMYWYMDEIAQASGFTMEDIRRINIEKLKAKQASWQRDDLQFKPDAKAMGFGNETVKSTLICTFCYKLFDTQEGLEEHKKEAEFANRVARTFTE